MAFKLNLSPDLREQIDGDRRETVRLYGLAPRWLARYLLTTVREIRKQSSFGPYDCVYDPQLFWNLVPELAYRLGEQHFTVDERSDPEVRQLSDEQLRFNTLLALQHTSAQTYWRCAGARVFFCDVANGNPVVFALDHLVKPSPDDWAAKHVMNVAHHRGITECNGTWTPAMDHY